MPLSLEISQGELARQAVACYQGKAYEIFLALNTTGLTTNSTYAQWKAREVSDASYTAVVGTIAAGSYDSGAGEYRMPTINATFTASAAGTGITYDSVVIRLASESSIYGRIIETPAVQLAAGQSRTYPVIFAQDDG